MSDSWRHNLWYLWWSLPCLGLSIALIILLCQPLSIEQLLDKAWFLQMASDYQQVEPVMVRWQNV